MTDKEAMNLLHCIYVERGTEKIEDVPEERRAAVKKLLEKREAAPKVQNGLARLYCRQVRAGKVRIDEVPKKHREIVRRMLAAGK